MSDEKKENPKDIVPKVLSREILEKQIKESEHFITYAQQQIAGLTRDVEQQIGVLGYARHLLKQFAIPSVPEEPKPTDTKKEEKKKPELEVLK